MRKKNASKRSRTRKRSAPRRKPLHKHDPQKGVWTPPRQPSAPVLHCIALDAPTRAAVLILYEKELETYPDLLSTKDIAALTGYKPHTVTRWCTEGKLKPLVRRPKCLIPKVWLLEFLASDDYNDIVRKSEKHYDMIARASRKRNK